MTCIWPRKQLGELIDVASGQVDPRVAPFRDMPHIGGDNIERDTGRIFRVQTAADLDLISGKYIFDETVVLYSKIRPNLNKVALPTFKGICSADIYPLHPRAHAMDRGFLAYLLRTQDFLGYAEKHSSRTNMPKLNRDALLGYEAPVPPLAEQKRIAAVLDKADDLRGKRRQALATLDTLLQSVFLDMFGDCSKGGKQWPLMPLGELAASTQLGLVRSSEQFGPGYEHPYIRMNAITAAGELDHSVVMRTDATAEEVAQCCLAPGDFLFNTRNSRELVGKTAVFEGEGTHLFNNNVMRIRFKPCIDPYFVLRYLHTQIGAASLEMIKAGTTSVFAIYWSKLKDLPIPVPPIGRQAEYRKVAGGVRQQRAVMGASISRLDALFAALQSAAFAGTLFNGEAAKHPAAARPGAVPV